MKKFLLGTILVVMFLACSGTKTTKEKWIGETKNNFIMKWGPPVRIFDDGGNGEVLVYAEQVFINSDNAHNSGAAGLSYWNYNYLFVNKEGKILSMRNEKQKFPPQAIDSQKILDMN